MNRKCSALMVTLLFLLSIGIVSAEQKLEIKLSNQQEIGREDLLFGSIVSVCEDDESNFYVLDRIEHKVFKFSQQGKLTLSFGNKGQGPGDFQNPTRITFTPKSQLVVADELYLLSFLETDGKFILRLDLNGRLAPAYAGENRFFAWIWQPEGRQQIMVDKENKLIQTFYSAARGTFSVSAPDSSGRQVMFNYGPDVYAPALIFSQYGKYSAVALSSRYEIRILDQKGETTHTLRRNLEPGKISKKEKDYFSRDIAELAKKRGWPNNVVRQLIKIIPKEKNFFDGVLVSKQHIFVFRIREDITQETAPLPVDVFTLTGGFLRTGQIK